MNFLIIISDLIIPIIFVCFLYYGFANKVNVYDAFVEGAKEGFKITYEILPTLIGLMVAVGILRSSGALDILCNFLSPIADAIGFPKEALPITFMRLVSSSASTGTVVPALTSDTVRSTPAIVNKPFFISCSLAFSLLVTGFYDIRQF